MRYDYTDALHPKPYARLDHGGTTGHVQGNCGGTNPPNPTNSTCQLPWGWDDRSGVDCTHPYDCFLTPSLQGDDANGNHIWRIYYNKSLQTAPVPTNFTLNAVIAIKSKGGSQAYVFDNRPIDMNTGSQDDNATPALGKSIGFNHVDFRRQARGVFIGGFTEINILNSRTTRETVNNVVLALSSSGGGPQINSPCDPKPTLNGTRFETYTTQHNNISNFTADGTGDDAVAIFWDNSPPSGPARTIVKNSTMTNSFARDLNLNYATQAALQADNINIINVTTGYLLKQVNPDPCVVNAP